MPVEPPRPVLHDVDQCEGLNSSARDACLNTVFSFQAQLTLNFSYCHLMSSYAKRVRCIVDVTEKTGDGANCARLSSEKDQERCYIEIASALLNASYCERVEEGFERDECVDRVNAVLYSSTSNDYTLCRSLTVGEYKDYCYRTIFIRLGEEGCREFVTEEDERALCLSRVIFEEAAWNQNLSRCDAIPLEWIRRVCVNCVSAKLAGQLPPDSDGDQLDDLFEYGNGLNPFSPDTDGDGTTDYDELFVTHTNPIG